MNGRTRSDDLLSYPEYGEAGNLRFSVCRLIFDLLRAERR